MGTDSVECGHQCRNTCVMLNEALKRETGISAYYEKMAKDCDEPEVRKFARELADEHTRGAERIAEKLAAIRNRADVLDDIIDSYQS